MEKRYEQPAVMEVGSFQPDTGFGLGATQETWWPIGDVKN